jgi:hypothetical protein
MDMKAEQIDSERVRGTQRATPSHSPSFSISPFTHRIGPLPCPPSPILFFILSSLSFLFLSLFLCSSLAASLTLSSGDNLVSPSLFSSLFLGIPPLPPLAASLNDLHVFDPVAQAWSSPNTSGVPPSPRDGLGFDSAAGKLYAFGGGYMGVFQYSGALSRPSPSPPPRLSFAFIRVLSSSHHLQPISSPSHGPPYQFPYTSTTDDYGGDRQAASMTSTSTTRPRLTGTT